MAFNKRRLSAVAALFISAALGVFGFVHYHLLTCGNSVCADDLLGIAMSLLICGVLALVAQVVALVQLLRMGAVQAAVAAIFFVVDAVVIPGLIWGVVSLYSGLSV